ncbi:MAG: aminotransferase class I/II-fold pyridoxal phosphate-dependent enzyme, partial [Planctomycetes bacterium]|nr:aminotransferase class I/II-fold pyridoxal phosphate-dependent enzyme [Planctomycetota bacterium]
MISSQSDPVVLGGAPVRPAGPPPWPVRDPAVDQAVAQALADGSWGRYHGPHVAALTRQLAEFHQVAHVVLCASGTAAVELALRGAGVGPGDEVLLAAYDFKGNFQDVLAVGGVPV